MRAFANSRIRCVVQCLLLDLISAHYYNTSARFLQDGTEYARIVVGYNTDGVARYRFGIFDWDDENDNSTVSPLTSFQEYFAAQRVYKFKRSSAVAMTVPVDEIESILNLPDVEFVEEDALVHGLQIDYNQSETVPWGIIAVKGQDDKDVPNNSSRDDMRDCFGICIVDAGILPHEDLPFQPGDDNFFGESFGLDDKWYESEDDHGIHIAGTIMATANNGIGVRGVLPDAKASNYCLMIARVFGSVRSTSTSVIDEAVEWCVDKGAKVINLSLGTSYRSRNSERLMETIEEEEDVLVVAAAGNAPDIRSLRTYFYPASFPGVISVGAVDSDLTVSSFSQRNSEVDVCAPGRDILSLAAKPETLLVDEHGDAIDSHLMLNSKRPTRPLTGRGLNCHYGLDPCSEARGQICIMKRGENTFTEKARNCYLGGGIAMVMYNNEPGSIVGTIGPDPPDIPAVSVPGEMADRVLEASNLTLALGIGSYAKLSGTSMASPHVVGAIAKIWAARPRCSKDQVRTAIYETAWDLGDSGRDDEYGRGLVQVVEAFEFLLGLPPPCGEAEALSNDEDDTRNDKNNSASASAAVEGLTSEAVRQPTKSPRAPRTASPTSKPTATPARNDEANSVWSRLKNKLNGSG